MPKPKTLKEYDLQQQAIFQPVPDVPGPDYKDVESVSEQDVEDYILNHCIASHRARQVRKILVNALKTLSDDQLKQIYGKVKGPKPEKRGTEADFIERIRKGSAETVLNAQRYDSTLETMLDAYGEALGKEKVEQVVNTPIPP